MPDEPRPLFTSADCPPQTSRELSAAAIATRGRLRLFHLFAWTTAVAVSLVAGQWLLAVIGAKFDSSSPVEVGCVFGLAVVIATACCAWPWYAAHCRQQPRTSLLPGERLWLLLAPLIAYRGFVLLVFTSSWWDSYIRSCAGSSAVLCGALGVSALLLARGHQPLPWRIAFATVAFGCLIEATVFLPVALEGYWLARPMLFLGAVLGQIMWWASLVFVIPIVWDLVPPSRKQLRWSYWVGGTTFLLLLPLHAVWIVMIGEFSLFLLFGS